MNVCIATKHTWPPKQFDRHVVGILEAKWIYRYTNTLSNKRTVYNSYRNALLASMYKTSSKNRFLVTSCEM